MAETDLKTTLEEPGKAETGGKKRINLRVGGPGVLLGALAVAFVVGAAIRIRRYRSLRKGDGGLPEILQAGQDHPVHQEVDATPETSCLSRILDADLTNNPDQVKIHEKEEASETDGEWVTREVSEEDGGECFVRKYEETEESDAEEVRPDQELPPEFREMKISHHGATTGRYPNKTERETVTVTISLRIWFWTVFTMLFVLLLLSVTNQRSYASSSH